MSPFWGDWIDEISVTVPDVPTVPLNCIPEIDNEILPITELISEGVNVENGN